jgi:hypothetical protein
MKWVTWQNVGVDRIGCAWLIRKQIDPRAEFLFIAEGATKMPDGAEPFDVPGARLSHHGGHCSFYALIREYNLNDPILIRIAAIIDEADTIQEVALEPAAAGLDLICSGIRLACGEDHIAIDRGAIVYDAVYAILKQENDSR